MRRRGVSGGHFLHAICGKAGIGTHCGSRTKFWHWHCKCKYQYPEKHLGSSAVSVSKQYLLAKANRDAAVGTKTGTRVERCIRGRSCRRKGAGEAGNGDLCPVAGADAEKR